MVGVLGPLLVYEAQSAAACFVVFVLLTIVSGLLDTNLARTPADIPDPLHVLFFVLIVLGVSVTAYLLLPYFVRAREAKLRRSGGRLLNLLPACIAERLKREGRVAAVAHPNVTVVFADVVDFTPLAARTPPDRVVAILDEDSWVTQFDDR